MSIADRVIDVELKFVKDHGSNVIIIYSQLLENGSKRLVRKNVKDFLEMKDEEIAVSQHRKVQSLKRTKYNVLQKLRRIIGEFEHEKDRSL